MLYPLWYLTVLFFLIVIAYLIWRFRLIAITPAFASENIIETMHDALIVCDAKGVIRIANPAAYQIFDYGARELTGRSIESLAGTNAIAMKNFKALMVRGNFKDQEFTLYSKFGGPISVSLSVSALEGQEKAVLGYVIVLRDIGDRKSMENELRSLNEVLEKRVKERTEALETKLDELQWLNEVMMNREERIIELKEKLNHENIQEQPS